MLSTYRAYSCYRAEWRASDVPRIRKHTCRRWPQSVRVRRTTITPENERYRPIWSYRFVSVERPAMSSIRHGDATVFSAAWPMPDHSLTSPSSVAASRLLNDCVTVRTHPTFDLSRRRFACSPAQWRSQKFSTGGASICSVPFCPFPFSCPTKSAVYDRKTSWHIIPPELIKKLCIFLTGSANATYATCMATPLHTIWYDTIRYNTHGRPHIAANGVNWPPRKYGWKIKKRKHAKKSSFLCLCYNCESNQGRQV